MNRDLLLAILSMDTFNRGYGEVIGGLDVITNVTKIGNATIKTDSVIQFKANGVTAGFYAIAYEWNGETIVSYRGTDGLNDITKGWTTGAGWTDQEQANLALEFYQAATGRDPFDVNLPTNVTLTGHSLGGGLAGFVSMISGAPALLFDHMPFGRAAADTYASAFEKLAGDIASLSSDINSLPGDGFAANDNGGAWPGWSFCFGWREAAA